MSHRRRPWMAVALLGLVLAAPARGATGWAPAGPMSGARSWHTATLLTDGRVLVAGGDNLGVPLASAELFDPATGTWSPAGAMVTARTGHQAVRLPSGRVLVAGGYRVSSGAGPTELAEIYDPGTNSWSAVGPMGTERTRFTMTPLPDGRVLAVGGLPGHDTAEAFTPGPNSWKSVDPLVRGRYDHAAATLADGRVLVAGGYTEGVGWVDTGERFNPQTDTWSAGGTMTTARSFLTATTLQNGKVLAVGGSNSAPSSFTAVDLYDPATNTWSGGAPLAFGRRFHAAARLFNGRVLVSGGNNNSGSVTSAEVYDPGGNAWNPAGNLSSARYAHSHTLLLDGRAVSAGGVGPPFFATADLWTPTTSLTSESAVAFGDQTIGAAGTAPVQITNTGDSPLLVGGVSIGGAQPGDFAVAGSGCGAAVNPGGTCVLSLRFAPTEAGARGAALTFSANTAAGTHAVTLSGRGVAVVGPVTPTPTVSPSPTPTPLPPERIRVVLSFGYDDITRRTTRLPVLTLKEIPAGSTVTATCPRSCARKRFVKTNARGTVSLRPLVGNRRLRAGTVITVVVSKPGAIGAVKQLTIRANRKPRLTTLCLPPGTTKMQACT